MYNTLFLDKRGSKVCCVGALMALVMVLMGTISGSSAAATSTPQASAELGSDISSEGAVVNLSALPQLSPEAAAQAISPPPPRKGVDAKEYQKRKDEAARNAAQFSQLSLLQKTGQAPAGSAKDMRTPGASKVFPGLQQVGGIRPSDMALAVSTRWVVQVVNSQINVYNKNGVVPSGFPKALGGSGGFFARATADIGDPRAFYDWKSKRFVVVADDFTGGTMWLAASQTADPRGLWNVYSLAPWGTANCRDATKACPDFPMIGFDDTTIYLSVNFFPAAGGVSDWVLLLPKAKIYSGAGFGYNIWLNLSWGGVLVDTVQPVTLLRGGEHPRAGFAIQSFNINFGGGQCSQSACNGLVIWAFSNNLQVPGSPGAVFSAVSVATANNYRLPANANQPGSANSVDTGDVRIGSSPTYHAGLISAALNTNGSDGRSHVLWFQVRPFLNDGAAGCTGTFLYKCAQVVGAEIVNEDCYFCGGQGAAGSTYYGALQPNDAGDLTMVFVYSDNNTFPESAYVSRRVTLSRNIMHDSGIVLCGNASLWTGGRWGDYSAVAGDLNSFHNTMWFSAMNTTAGGHWGACIGRNGFSAINQP